MYTIGQVSERFDLPVSTLRYYDKEGLFPALTRTSGIRRFGEQELEALRVIECLKRSGLEIKEIKQFMAWCALCTAGRAGGGGDRAPAEVSGHDPLQVLVLRAGHARRQRGPRARHAAGPSAAGHPANL